MKSLSYAVFVVALFWVPSIFAQGNVTQMQKGPEPVKQAEPESEEPPMEELKNDGSLEDLYRSRRNTLKSVSKIQKMMSLPGSQGYPISEAGLGDTSDLYVTNETCPQITKSAAYPHLCKLFKNPYFSAGSAIVFSNKERLNLLLVIEFVFLIFISLLRSAKRKKVTELFSIGSIFKEIRFTILSTAVAVAVIPISVFGKGYISLIWGLIQG